MKTFRTKKEADMFGRSVAAIGASMPLIIGRKSTPLMFETAWPRGKKQDKMAAIIESLKATHPTIRPTTGEITVHMFAEVPPAHVIADVDNLLKPVLDAMRGVVYFDDTQITECLVRRIPGPMHRLTVKLWTSGLVSL